MSNFRPLNFYPLSHFPFYFIVNEGEIKARKEVLSNKRGFLLEFQEDEKTYLLQPNTNYTSVEKVKNTTLNFL